MGIKIDELVNSYIDDIIKIRRDIHNNPELGMNEVRTSEVVEKNLQGLGLDIKTGIGNTGVVAVLSGKNSGKTLLLRADMDALPLNEVTDIPFKSRNAGIMHACGHDVHTAVLIGTAKVLSRLREHINGNIKFVFQPAEECNPTGGATYMIKDGVLENPKVDAALALHVWDLPLGKIAIKPGVIMAQSDRIFIKIKGKSSHGSAPHQGADAIIAAAHVLTALQTIVSRNINPLDSAAISIGVINGGYRYNVIADEVNLEGTVRTFSNITAGKIPHKIKEIVNNVCLALGCISEFKYVNGYPLTYNDEKLTYNVINSLEGFMGKNNVIIAEKPATAAEDFAFFNKHVPCAFMWLGCKSEINKNCCVIHNPNFICDERSIAVGIRAMCHAALGYLNG
ncbi:M20 metallopeptidase family protein [Clostridium rectalis]|uniref:M20 metallopeptidase family protein n=1 Tax=Clostridium rectalis TaxID=2040295 RepID=UPI000F63FE52|nr:amidohydrolase [Clostridium rectalis]